MENNNNSKQVVLSIVGIAILVIAVVGVSFAFFTYSRTGAKNNIITTGSITFELEDQEPQIKATDAFPLTTNEEIATAPSTNFDVTGSLPSGAAGVTYKVYAIKGTAPTEPANPQSDTSRTWEPFADSQISLGLSTTAIDSEVTIVPDYKYDGTSNYGGAITDFTTDTKDGKGTQGLLLATGTLGAGKTIDHKFTIKMWINNTVTISDTDYSKTYRASDTKTGDSPLTNGSGEEDPTKLTYVDGESETDDRAVYSDHYYAIKIMVVASDDPNFQG